MSNERLAISAAELDDLDTSQLFRFVERRAGTLLALHTREEVAVRLGLLSKISPRLVPSTAGLYLFGLLPQAFFPEWGVVAVHLRGTDLTAPVIEQHNLDGALPALLSQCVEFVAARNLTNGLAEYDALKVREALVNALVHRDLRKPSRVALRLFSDRLEIWSPGGPPEGFSDVDEVAKEGGISHPRNPIIAATARVLGMGEQIGRGLPLMAREAEGDARVEFHASPRDFTVTLPARWQRGRTTEQLS
jgi:ATP-dependent DNA helicase RecG